MRVKHGTMFRVTCTVPKGHRGIPGQVDLVPVENLDAHMTVLSVMHGFVSGLSAGDGAKIRVAIVDKSDILEGDDLCPHCT